MRFFNFSKEKEYHGNTFIIAGLGNPGREYRANRHNVGFMIIDRLCDDLKISLTRMQSKALIGSRLFEGYKVILAKPQTYMNLSGHAIAGVMHFYKIPIERLVVIHDDLDLPLGVLRLRPGGGAGGQKGVQSCIQQLGRDDFARLRVGIGRPPGQMDAAAYVLQNFLDNELDTLAPTISKAASAIQTFITDGLNKAMNLYNGNVIQG